MRVGRMGTVPIDAPGRVSVRARLGVLLGCALLALSACSGDGEEPTVLPTQTTDATSPPTTATTQPIGTTSADPTPTTTLTLPPSQVPEVDEFVRSFFAAYNAAQDSGDFAAFDAMYLPQCTGCVALRDELEGWLADRGSIEGADWVILQISSEPAVDNFASLALAYRSAGEHLAAQSTTELDETPVQLFNFFIRPAGATFQAEDLAFGDAE